MQGFVPFDSASEYLYSVEIALMQGQNTVGNAPVFRLVFTRSKKARAVRAGVDCGLDACLSEDGRMGAVMLLLANSLSTTRSAVSGQTTPDV